ncbi:hypothetical protein AVEN_25630-1 [Araneus ventricosus]|uniref:Uncharacterized protein n=1 Tax=Araneus ventricosus TaxID=182803 RepID=A0A4Y2BR14_ARAVE|nr:hypothetical protein AVEN_25630-1 [Araneus ventricosus]
MERGNHTQVASFHSMAAKPKAQLFSACFLIHTLNYDMPSIKDLLREAFNIRSEKQNISNLFNLPIPILSPPFSPKCINLKQFFFLTPFTGLSPAEDKPN